MKLHVLEIQAFGPFATKETIEFSVLGENPLFLIDGSTGAGKSSILHAVCYALYGETTDSDRKELGLRCDHADIDVLTELSLEFSIRGDTYRITRIPTQMRPTKRGQGETEQKASAHLRRVFSNGEEKTLVAKKKTEADLKIADIIGLTAQQFLQVIVLPQGKFRTLLLAKSKDRQAILSTLFQTEIYKRIEQLLQDQAATIEKDNQRFEDKKVEAFSDVNVVDFEVLENTIKEAASVLMQKLSEKDKAAGKKQQAVTALEIAAELNRLFETQHHKKKVLERYLQSTDEVNTQKARIQRAEKATAITPIWQTLQVIVKDSKDKQKAIVYTEIDQEKAVSDVSDAKQVLAQAVEDYKQRDDLKAEQARVESYKTTLVFYQSLQEALVKADKRYSKAINQKTSLERQASTITCVLENLNLEIETLDKAIANKAGIVEQKLIAEGRYKKRVELEEVHVDLSNLIKRYDKQKNKFTLAEEEHEKIEKKANRIEMHWFSNQAVVLAEKLEEDQPCTVCGSRTHPNPAYFSADLARINQDAVDEARALQTKHMKGLVTIKEKLQDYLYSVTDKEKDVKELEIELADVVNQSVEELERVYKVVVQKLQVIEEKEKKLLIAKQQKAAKEGEGKPITNEMRALVDQIPELASLKATAQSELDSANKTLPENYRDIGAIDRVLNPIRQKIIELETKHTAVHQQYTDSLTHQSSIDSTLKTLNINLDELNQRHVSQSQLWQQALIDNDFATQEDFSVAQLAKNDFEALQQKVKSYDDNVQALRTELNLLQKQLTDKQLPDLESLQQQCDALNNVFKEAETVWTEASQRVTQLSDTKKKIELIESQQTEIKKQYEVVGVLFKAASGRGNVRVSLERFVLGNLLDQVLSIASDRLYSMSKGQYRLIREDEVSQKKNIPVGLDLAIDDAHTGKIRPVATLSGGESFIASLALALGLSDVVQERSGGIQLDTLFIDEGFGSLDQESLQLAIDTLIDLQSTGRTIGIISHVSELKEQMAQRIEVVGSRRGSCIKMSFKN